MCRELSQVRLEVAREDAVPLPEPRDYLALGRRDDGALRPAEADLGGGTPEQPRAAASGGAQASCPGAACLAP